MSLRDAKIRSLKPFGKPFKASGFHGLYPLSRHGYLKYRITAKNSILPSELILPSPRPMHGKSVGGSAECWRWHTNSKNVRDAFMIILAEVRCTTAVE